MAEVEVETQFGDGLEMLLASGEPFDKLQKLLKSKKIKADEATAQQVGQARIAAGKDNSVSRYGSWVAEDFIYAQNGKIYITSKEYSPILKHAEDATKAHRSGNEYFVPKKELDEIIKAAEEDLSKPAAERRVYVLEQTESYEIPVSKFAEDGLAQFLFKGDAQKYAEFLKDAGIKNVPVYLAGKEYQKQQKKPFARALWLRILSGRSGLDGDCWDLGCSNRLRGVRKASEASAAQKISEYETITQKYGIESPEQLQGVLERYSKIQSLVKE